MESELSLVETAASRLVPGYRLYAHPLKSNSRAIYRVTRIDEEAGRVWGVLEGEPEDLDVPWWRLNEDVDLRPYQQVEPKKKKKRKSKRKSNSFGH